MATSKMSLFESVLVSMTSTMTTHVLPLPHRIHTDTERPTATATTNANPSPIHPPLPAPLPSPQAPDLVREAVVTEEGVVAGAGGGEAAPEQGCRGGPHRAVFPL